MSPAKITESISPKKVEENFENLNERFSRIAEQLNYEDTNVSSGYPVTIDSNSSTKLDIDREIRDFPVISERKLKAPTSPPPSSLLIRNKKNEKILNNEFSPLAKRLRVKLSQDFLPLLSSKTILNIRKEKVQPFNYFPNPPSQILFRPSLK